MVNKPYLYFEPTKYWDVLPIMYRRWQPENRPTYNIKYNRSVSMDKNSNLTHSSDSIPLQFISSGYDEETKEIIIKVVNAADVPYSQKFPTRWCNQGR